MEKRKRQRGSAIVEFALVAVFLTPILVSMITVGFNTSRAIQVTQVTRDAASMYARFVDFSIQDNQEILVRLTQGMGMTLTGGNGVIILSKVTYIADADCTAGGKTGADCTNRNKYVIRNRIVVGNKSYHASNLGTPSNTSLASNGDALNILTDATLQSNNFSTLLTLGTGEYAFVAESFFDGIAWTVPSTGLGNQLAARWIF